MSLWLLLVSVLRWSPGAPARTTSYTGADDAAERAVFSSTSGVAFNYDGTFHEPAPGEERAGSDDSVASRVATAGLRLSSVLRYDAVEGILRSADLLEAEDLWVKPNKPMLLQGWWDDKGAQRGLLRTGANASDPLTQLVRLFMLRRSAHADVVRDAVGGNDTLNVLLELGVLYPVSDIAGVKSGNPQLLASSVQLFPLRGPASRTTPITPRDLLVATDWHRRRPQAEAAAAVMTIGSDSQALAAWLRSAPCPSSPGRTTQLLDLCTGSGVQAIVLGRRCPAAKLTLVDKSLRALRFARFNLLLNGELRRATPMRSL